MDAMQFVYWLNGYLELSKCTTLDEHAVTEIRNHISLVLQKVTPLVTGPQITIDPIEMPPAPLDTLICNQQHTLGSGKRYC